MLSKLLSWIRDFFRQLFGKSDSRKEDEKEKDIGKEEESQEENEERFEESPEHQLPHEEKEPEMSDPLRPPPSNEETVEQEDSAGKETKNDNLFWVASWANVPASSRNIVEMGWVRGNGIGTSGISDRDLDTLAEVLKKSPKGRRTLFPWRWRNSLLWHKNKSNSGNINDRTVTPSGEFLDIPSPYFHFAMKDYQREVEVVAQGLLKRGVEVDRIVVDDENSGYLSGWQRTEEEIDAIIADPRFRTHYWPSPDRGRDVKTLHDMLGDITGADVRNRNTRHFMYRWNAAMDFVFHVQLNEVLFGTLRRYFPNIRGSNYSSSIVRENEATPDLNGHPQHSMSRFGTNPSGPFYGRINQLASFHIDIDDPTKLVRSSEGEILGKSGWVGLLRTINQARSMTRSDSTPIHAWVADSLWGESTFNQNSEYSEYYSELLFHLALSGAEHFMHWTPFAPGYGVSGTETVDARTERFERVLALDDMVTELNRVAGGHVLVPVRTERLAWNSDYIVSCATMTVSKNLWRVTANRDVLSMNVNGTTVEFGEGMRGLWLEVPKSVDFRITDVRKVGDIQLPNPIPVPPKEIRPMRERIVEGRLIGGSGPDVSRRRVGTNVMPRGTGWKEFVDTEVASAFKWGVRRFWLHNPFGTLPGLPNSEYPDLQRNSEHMRFDQYLEAAEGVRDDLGRTIHGKVDFLVDGFVESWEPVTNGKRFGEPMEVVGYIGTINVTDEKDVVNPPHRMQEIYEQGGERKASSLGRRILSPIMQAGMSIGADASVRLSDSGFEFNFYQQLKEEGHTVYVESRPRVDTPRWAEFPVMALDTWWERSDPEKYQDSARWAMKNEDIRSEVVIMVQSPGTSATRERVDDFVERVRDYLHRGYTVISNFTSLRTFGISLEELIGEKEMEPELVEIPEETPIVTPRPPRPSTRHLLEGGGWSVRNEIYKGLPVEYVEVIYQGTDPNSETTGVIDIDRVVNQVVRLSETRTNELSFEWLMLDFEKPFLSIILNGTEDSRYHRTLKNMTELVSSIRKRLPHLRITHYGIPNLPYWVPLSDISDRSGSGSWAHPVVQENWEKLIERYAENSRPFVENLDWISPVIYDRYEEEVYSENEKEGVRNRERMYRVALMEASKRIANGKPVIPVGGVSYAPGGTSNSTGKLIPLSEMVADQLNPILENHADGFMIWSRRSMESPFAERARESMQYVNDWTPTSISIPLPEKEEERKYTSADIGALMADWGMSNSKYDFNGDGKVDGADLMILMQKISESENVKEEVKEEEKPTEEVVVETPKTCPIFHASHEILTDRYLPSVQRNAGTRSELHDEMMRLSGSKPYYIYYPSGVVNTEFDAGRIDTDKIAENVIRNVGENFEGLGMLDYEGPWFIALDKPNGDPERERTVNAMIVALRELKQRFPKMKWSYYGIPRARYWLPHPSPTNSYTWANAPEAVKRAEMDNCIRKYAPILAECDYMSPSTYNRYDPDTARGNIDAQEYQWRKYCGLLAHEVNAINGTNLPIYPMYSPYYYCCGNYEFVGKLVQLDFMERVVFDPFIEVGVDGFMYWNAIHYWAWTAIPTSGRSNVGWARTFANTFGYEFSEIPWELESAPKAERDMWRDRWVEMFSRRAVDYLVLPSKKLCFKEQEK